MAGVIAGLNSAPITRLKRTKEQLNQKTTTQKADLDRTLDSSKNFSNYKDMLKTINPPCVPFFGEQRPQPRDDCLRSTGFYLSALTFIEDGNKDYVSPPNGMTPSTSSSSLSKPGPLANGDSTPKLINFFKRQLSADILRDIQQYQSQPYNLSRCKPVYDYVMAGLEAVEKSGDLYELSLKLEPREREEERM